MTQTERLSVLSELDHVVSAIEQFNAPLGVDERRKLLVSLTCATGLTCATELNPSTATHTQLTQRTSLTTLHKQNDEFRTRRVRPQIVSTSTLPLAVRFSTCH